MKIIQIFTSIITAFALFVGTASAADHSTIAVAIGGYDLVSYHQSNGPKIGNGHNMANYEGNIYAFINAENRAKFEANPAKYLPAFGGYCAYGASLGKKFYGDPLTSTVVDGKLYLNLDSKVKSLWVKERTTNIEAANKLWASIKYVPATEL